MRIKCLIIVCILVWCAVAVGWGANSVVVESMQTSLGETGAQIRVKITNDVPLRALVIPLVFRETDTGAFITSVQLSYGDRLPIDSGVDPLSDIVVANDLGQDTSLCDYSQSKGFAGDGHLDGAIRNGENRFNKVLFVRTRIFSSGLEPGSDDTGSIILTVDVTDTAGVIEIDTTCTDLANHLIFVQDNPPDNTPIVPSFTSGTITISCCNHDGLRGDANYDMGINVADPTFLTDYLFFDGPVPPCFDEGDADGNGSINVADPTYLTDYLFFGGPAPAPCP
jgi:hypothetical protein